MKKKNSLTFLVILMIMLGVFFINMTFAGFLPGWVLILMRISLTFIFFISWWIMSGKKEVPARHLAFTLGAVNLAFLVVSFFQAELWGLNLETARGIALAKLSDSFFICMILIGAFMLAGYKPKEIYLAKGKLFTGLVIGILSFFLMGFLAVINPGQPPGQDFWKNNLPWILVFVLANGFMEELLFRGIFLNALNRLFRPVGSIVLTALVFSAAHMQVTYTSQMLFFLLLVLVLGLIWGFLFRYTRSIIASMLFHAGADLMIIIPVFSSFGVNG